MKKILTLLVMALCAVTISHAQLQRGNIIVGSDLAGFEFGLKKGSNTDISLVPKAMWFIHDNIAVGAYVKFGLLTAKDQGTDITYGIGPIGRYYISDEKVNLSATWTLVF